MPRATLTQVGPISVDLSDAALSKRIVADYLWTRASDYPMTPETYRAVWNEVIAIELGITSYPDESNLELNS